MRCETQGLVSVIVPVYNVEKYIRKCLNSIISQTYSNMEIIIVNDGSTDNSDEIIRNNYLTDERVKYFVKENGGLSSARNYGIEKSSGEFICFIDSDDWIRNDYIEVMYNTVLKDQSDVVICNMQYIYEDGSVKSRTPSINEEQCVDPKEAVREILCGEKFKFHAQNKFCRAKLFKDFGIRFSYGKLYEDVFTTYKLLYNAKKVSFTKEYLYFYLQNRPGSILNTRFSEKRFDIFEAMDNIIHDEKIIAMGLKDEIQRFYIINVISLVNYIYPIFKDIDKSLQEYYVSRILNDNNKGIADKYWSNPCIDKISKIRFFLLTKYFKQYCSLMNTIKKN
ncbi:glycosyltransferase family 2 protein [Terrisporobacter mayombei]|uniref:glycosyltransferase family 2 protein n=1 Tax=Terrisporobacter mayombei TaxID=1541 RepID=UPI0026580A2D|nr:glycosyltransferase [Terrisporobacter mayombei]MCC3671239.1 glycosyltransferase [Terrisporobacter mayombei]